MPPAAIRLISSVLLKASLASWVFKALLLLMATAGMNERRCLLLCHHLPHLLFLLLLLFNFRNSV